MNETKKLDAIFAKQDELKWRVYFASCLRQQKIGNTDRQERTELAGHILCPKKTSWLFSKTKKPTHGVKGGLILLTYEYRN